MKKNTVLIVVGLFSLISLAEGQKKVKLTPEQRQKVRDRIALVKGGPKIAKPGTQKGVITFVNAQSRAKEEWISSSIEYLKRETNFKIALAKGSFNLAKPVLVGDFSIYIVDSPDLPRTLIAPVDRWAMMNVSRIAIDKEQFFEARTKKEISRVFASLCGGMSSNYALSLVSGMPTPEKLDRVPNSNLPLDVVSRMPAYMQAFGVTPAEMHSYRKACQEGWAPPPTNKIEKIIWDKVHAMPTAQIKIKPETKKVRE